MGWDRLEIREHSRLLCGIGSAEFVHFSHAYCAPLIEAAVAACDYGKPFPVALERHNLFGVRFHPEKPGEIGLGILKTFAHANQT